jgi:Family of unknown function (DUF6127)
MDEQQLNLLIERAAERGARRALESVGLHDENAGKDIHDLRTLIDGWRQTRSTITKTITQWVTMGILGALALGAYTHLKDK